MILGSLDVGMVGRAVEYADEYCPKGGSPGNSGKGERFSVTSPVGS